LVLGTGSDISQGSFFFFDHGFISFVCHGADVKLIVLLYYLPQGKSI
jgi:hypothetical protein